MRRAAFLLLLACAWPAAGEEQSGQTEFDIVDLDGDGRISPPVYVERISYAFLQMDRNRDGVVDEGEQLVAGSPRLTLAQLHAQLLAQFARQDKNHDGLLSPREFLAPPG